MDQVDKMKLTKYGFGFNLLGASSILSLLGIVVSIIGVIGSIACFMIGSMFDVLVTVILYVTGATYPSYPHNPIPCHVDTPQDQDKQEEHPRH